MMVALPAKSSNHDFLISKIISRLRFKRRNSRGNTNSDEYLDTRPPLIPAPYPLVLAEHQASLSTLGWTTITFPEATVAQDTSKNVDFTNSPDAIPACHPLQVAYQKLFRASQAFFDLPDSQKKAWKHKLASEEGWTKIPGEKEFITLRTLEYCPDILKRPAEQYWNLMGSYLSSTLGRISTSIGLSDDEDAGLRHFIGPCGTMPHKDKSKTATMIRLFRYEGEEPKVVAEPHADLGLLSVVVGDVPGLEVWDGHGWFEVEREVEKAGKRGASMLVGKQLERLSCGRYGAGGHRVVSYGAPVANEGAAKASSNNVTMQYRYSIVFVLRAHEDLFINSDELETEITGRWPEPLRGVTVGKFYAQIRGAHYNVNIGLKEREKQRKNIERLKGKEVEPPA